MLVNGTHDDYFPNENNMYFFTRFEFFRDLYGRAAWRFITWALMWICAGIYSLVDDGVATTCLYMRFTDIGINTEVFAYVYSFTDNGPAMKALWYAYGNICCFKTKLESYWWVMSSWRSCDVMTEEELKMKPVMSSIVLFVTTNITEIGFNELCKNLEDNNIEDFESFSAINDIWQCFKLRSFCEICLVQCIQRQQKPKVSDNRCWQDPYPSLRDVQNRLLQQPAVRHPR